MQFDNDMAQWIVITLIIPAITWVNEICRKRRIRKDKTERLLLVLCGLPPDAKAQLIDFYIEGVHTLARDLWSEGVDPLLDVGFLMKGRMAPRGEHDAAQRYFTVRADVLEVMSQWILSDTRLPMAAIDIAKERLARGHRAP